MDRDGFQPPLAYIVRKVQPPILSRVYQTLSRGFVNLLNAKKIADTRFPFPFSQLISGLLFVHVVMLPMLISAVIHEALQELAKASVAGVAGRDAHLSSHLFHVPSVSFFWRKWLGAV